MGLLKPADYAAIRGAIGLVTDTFFVTRINFHRRTISLDPWQEDREPQKTVVWAIDGMVTPVLSREALAVDKRQGDGIADQQEVTVTFAMKDLKVVPGIISTDGTFTVNMSPYTDHFFIGTDETHWQVIRVTKHGPLDAEDILVKVTGARIEPKA